MEQLLGTLGIDLGSVNIKAAWLPGGLGDGRPMIAASTAAQGRPVAALEELLRESFESQIDGHPFQLSLTGIAQDLIGEEIPATRTNEVVATSIAVADAYPGTRTVLDVGGQFTKWILLDGDRVAEFALNGLCAAGSGAFLEQQAARLKLSAAELGKLASEAKRGATVAGRCSVFAKSDMIHLQQKGTPFEEIAYGVCLALARTFAATVLDGRQVEPPVVIVGGGAANPGLVRALCEVFKLAPADVRIPSEHLTLGARGAAIAARELERLELPELLDGLSSKSPVSPKVISVRSHLKPLRKWASVEDRPAEDPPRDGSDDKIEAYLGIDVGSVSTNLVLLAPNGEVVQGIYLPTRGRPIEVLDDALSRMEAKYGGDLKVLAVGTTGSGRHLAARALGGDTVKNEITAQMTSAAQYFPDVDTVFEIGGQDSKYIGARDGRLAAFEMNKICAAGTGSFLEEQAERLGVKIKHDFAAHALESDSPQDLGSRCTVFMDTELVRAQQRGVPLADICAGLAYSIARNYLEKVVSNHQVGNTVVFQGGTASNQAVVAAMRALTGKRIVVHPFNRISGAIGAALLGAREHQRTREPSKFRGYDSCKDAKTRSFECKRCPNRCLVTRIEVGGQISHFGDTCERYTERDGQADIDQASRPPDFFAARDALMQSLLPPRRPGRPRAILPRASNMLEVAPLWAWALDELGYDVSLTPPSTLELIELGSSGLAAEVCLPIKIASGHIRRALREDADIVFFPSLMELPDRTSDGKTHTCFYPQELPHLLRGESGPKAKLVAPQCSVSATRDGVREAVQELVRHLGVDQRKAWRAMKRGLAVQKRFDRERAVLGRSALERFGDRAVVVLGRPYNLHDPLINLDLAKRLRRLSLPAIPMDLLPLERTSLGNRYWRILWRHTRDQLRTLELIRSRPGLFPLLISSFGCGLDAFGFKHLEEPLSRKPSLTLEFDEHRGEAGVVTRLEAFIDELDEHLSFDAPVIEGDTFVPSSVTSGIWEARPRKVTPPLSGRIFVPNISEHAYAIAASLHSVGFETEVLPPPDEATVKLGEEHSTGGECHPWVIMAGELARWATSGSGARGDVFYYPQATSPCLIGQYGDAHRRLLSRLGLDDRYHVWAFDGARLIGTFGGKAALRMYEGIAAMDILIAAACSRRPYEAEPGEVNRIHSDNVQMICSALAAGEWLDPTMDRAISRLLSVPKSDEPQRPIIGVCGDLYTRTNPIGNADLFARLEAMGCQVWAHPYLSGLLDAGSEIHRVRWANRGQLTPSMLQFVNRLITGARSDALRQALPPELAKFCDNPAPAEARRRAATYLGPISNNLIVDSVGKMVDYAQGGADGIISAVGIGCMMGVVVDGAMRHMRRDYPDLPMVTLSYGCNEGPAQRVKLETFVHQVHQRSRVK